MERSSNSAPRLISAGEFRFVTGGNCRCCDLEIMQMPTGRVVAICIDSADSTRGVGDVVERLAEIVCRRWAIDPYALVWIERGTDVDQAIQHRVSFVVGRSLRSWKFFHPRRDVITDSELHDLCFGPCDELESVSPGDAKPKLFAGQHVL